MKTVWILVGVVVVILVVWLLQKKVPVPYTYQTPNPSVSVVSKPGTKGGATGTVPSTQSATYQELLKQYEGKVVQFDNLCHGTPGQMVVKTGSKVLLDNRSNITLEIGLDNQSYSLAPYHYQIATMSSKKLPYSLGIDCKSKNGSNTNTTTVQIQASILQQLP